VAERPPPAEFRGVRGQNSVMNLRLITLSDIEDHPLHELHALRERDDGFLWLDIPEWGDEARELLKQEFRFHPVALENCRDRNHMPMVHGYSDHVFLVLHRPLVQDAGHAHLVELDQFIGDRFLVTVHGPVNPLVPHVAVMEEVTETLQRMRAKRIWPDSAMALAHGLISLIGLRQRVLIQDVATRIATLEKQVMSSSLADPEGNLEDMFRVRHELLTVRTMASHSAEVLSRMRWLLHRDITPANDDLLADLEDMFRRVHRMTDGEQEFLAGVIELYRTRTDTKMMIAGERLAVLAAVTLPVTAVSSVYGMNVIVNAKTQLNQLVFILVVMLVISGLLLRYTKRQGWW
jgi:magnesium transporter